MRYLTYSSANVVLLAGALAMPCLGQSYQAGVQYPDTAPQRGVAPIGSYAFDKLETINKITGNLSYSIPLTSMPMGRGGFSVPINLTYNSVQYDYSYNYYYGTQPPYPAFQTQSLTGDEFAGWSVHPQYSLYLEGKVYPNNTGNNCTTTEGPNRTSIVMPDGSRHVLYFYAFQEGFVGEGDGYYPWEFQGGSGCVNFQSLAGTITLSTADGSYIRVVANPSTAVWTAYFPDGTTFTSTSIDGIPGTFSDRNGNTISINNYQTSDYTVYNTVLQDNMGRTVTIQRNDGNPAFSTITQAGFGGAPLKWTFSGDPSVPSAPFNFYYDCKNSQPGPGQSSGSSTCQTSGAGGGGQILQVPSNDPNNPLVYKFEYGALSGLLQTVILPTGASTTYSYQCNDYTQCFLNRSDLLNPVVSKQVTWYDQSDGGQTQRTENTSYGGTGYSYGYGTFTKTGPDSSVETSYIAGPTFPVTTKMIEPNGDSTDYVYSVNLPYGSAAVSHNPANPIVAAAVKNVTQNGSAALSAATFYQYDRNGNQLSATSYDWAPYSTSGRDSNGVWTSTPPASGALLKTVQNTYTVTTAQQAGSSNPQDDSNGYWNPASLSTRFLHLLSSSSTTGTGTGEFSTFAYDGNGNPTQANRWDSNKSASQPSVLNSSNSSVTSWTWDGYGNLTQETDPNGFVTKYNFDYNSLYLSQKVQALGTPVARSFSYGWDSYLGLLTSKTDSDNGITTSYGYDATGRLTSVSEGAGQVTRQTQTTYDDANRRVTVKSDQNTSGDGLLTNITTYDQLGRVALTQQMESATDTSGIKVQTRYQYSGNNSYKLVSNPYRASTSAGAGGESTMGWTLTTYDQNGRSTSSNSINGSDLPQPWGGNSSSSGMVTTTYSAQNTTVTDQAGSQRTSAVDGAGRLSSVTEYPGTGTYVTNYSYDVLDDLVGVNQSGQARTFVYDSLKRLIASTTPETFSQNSPAALGCAGGVYANCYSYDSNGNLISKTDNRGLTVGYQYDPLNRLTGKGLVSSTSNAPTITFSYDSSGQYSKGLLSSVSTLTGDTSTTSYGSYDALGRVLTSSQTTAGNTYNFSYSYNLAGSLTSETYPSGRTVNTCYDGANRSLQVGGTSCGSATGAYASNILYASQGAPTQIVRGNNLWRTQTYNSRLQTSSFIDSVNNNPGDELLSVNLLWGTNNNNGNLQGANYYNGGPGYPQFLYFNESFLYDGVNRLTSACDSMSSHPCDGGGWSRNYAYDAFGNMSASGNPAIASLAFNGNNQIVGQTYDQTGNQQSVNGNALGYDFDNHIVNETDGVTQAMETYVYDGDGRRVEKYGPGGAAKSVFVYDVLGRLAAEYSTTTTASPCTTCYLSSDHLGTTRLVTDSGANVISRHDYLPFGEEVAANQFGRDSHWGPGNDSINQKFTGKERDSESGLDYFGARYYGSALGRFTSVDDGSDQDASDPQSWNLYSYVRNSPLSSTDPDGHGCQTATFTTKDVNGNIIQQSSEADFSSCFHFLGSFFDNVSSGLQTVFQSANHYVNSLDSSCVTAATATGMVGGGMSGGAVAVAATVTGPADVAIGPTAIVGGAAIGGAAGLAHGLTSCMSSSGNGGGGGSTSGANSSRAQQIADGHAYTKHAKEFGNISKQEFKDLIEETMDKGISKSLQNGRTGYWNSSRQMVVIENPMAPDGGTAFRPTNGFNYFNNLR